VYTWTHVTSADHPGQQLKNIPEHVVQLLLRTTLPGAVGMTLRGRWERGRFADDAGDFPLSDVRTVDAKVSRTFGRLRAEIEALNLFDERYAYIGSILADFRGNPTLLEFPAAGRAVRATLAWRY
jgi:outer membrane receptor protein involved in Fe transport